MSTTTPDEPQSPRADADPDTELVPAVTDDATAEVSPETTADATEALAATADETQALPVTPAPTPEPAPEPEPDETRVLPGLAEADEPAVTPTAAFATGSAAPTERVPLEKAAGVPLTKAPRPAEPGRPSSTWAEATPVTPAPARRRLRVSTVVWGLMLVAAGVWILAWASGARIDVQLALIVLLAAGGAALLVGSIVSGARHSRR